MNANRREFILSALPVVANRMVTLRDRSLAGQKGISRGKHWRSLASISGSAAWFRLSTSALPICDCSHIRAMTPKCDQSHFGKRTASGSEPIVSERVTGSAPKKLTERLVQEVEYLSSISGKYPQKQTGRILDVRSDKT